MISLGKTRQLILEFRFFIIALLIIISILIFIAIKTSILYNPKTIYIFQVSNDIPLQTKNTSINFQAQKITVPPKMGVYSSTLSELGLTQAATLALKLGFVNNPTIIPAPDNEKIYIWHNPKESLSIKLISQTLHYSKTADPKQNIADLKNNIDSSRNFINKLGLNFSTIDFNSPQIQYLNTLDDDSQGTKKDAHFIKFKYYPAIDNYQLLTQNPNKAVIETIIDSNKEALLLDVDLKIIPNIQKNKDYPTINFNEVFKKLKNSEGLYLSSTGIIGYAGNPPVISSLNIKKAEIAYILKQDQNTKAIYLPIVKFEGEAVLSNNQHIDVLIAIPVIRGMVFSKL